MRRGLVVVLLCLALAPLARAAAPLPTRLAQALAVPGSNPATSAAIAIDLSNGRPVFERNADSSLAPASNEKLLVTYAALVSLGVTYRFRTEVVSPGHLDGSTWHGNVYLKGFGDPTLTSLGLRRLAAQLETAGIERIDGRVVGDESWFDQRRTAAGWKSSFFLFESPPLSALVVDHGVYDGHLSLQPALAAAGRFKQLLRARGILTGPASVGRASGGASVLAEVESAALPKVLQEMDRDSDNLTAELMLKQLGAEIGKAGTTAAGAAVALHDLAAAGVPLAGIRIADGSGLSLDDRVTARALVSLLVAAWDNPDLRTVFWRALPVAGENGTLEKRMERAPTRGVVRAKTGTTDHASALSGYAGTRYAFVIIQNGSPVLAWAARHAQDRFATALASVL